jgi:RNA polymerase sigma factor (sigma-70 family)
MDTAEITVLMHRAAEGDQAAWNAIVDDYAGLVWSVVRGYRLGEAQAADAVQTTWLRLVEHLGDIREPERVAGWLQTTARRVCLKALRESGRECPMDWDPEDSRAASGRSTDHQDSGPEVSVLQRERETLVREALAGLPERHRLLLQLLTSSPPLSYGEISTRLCIPVGSIGPTRARILARLRSALEAVDFCDLAVG